MHDGRESVEPALGRERRARRHRAAEPVQAGEQRRLLPHDVRPRAVDDAHVEREPGAQDVLAEQPRGARCVDRRLQRRSRPRVLRPHEHDALARADRVPRERHALEHERGAALHQVLVDVRAGVALVPVRDDEAPLPGGRAGQAPLLRRGEPRAAAPAEVGLGDLREELLRVEPRQHVRQRRPVAWRGQGGLGQEAARRGLLGVPCGAGQHALDDARARVDHIAVADGGRAVAEAQADGFGERDGAVGRALARREPEAVLQLVLVGAAGRREARRPRADAHVPAPARGAQVVVERRDAVHRGLREAGGRRRGAHVVVRELAALAHGSAEQLDDGRRAGRCAAAHELNEVAAHGAPSLPGSTPRRCSLPGAASRRAAGRCARPPRRPRRRSASAAAAGARSCGPVALTIRPRLGRARAAIAGRRRRRPGRRRPSGRARGPRRRRRARRARRAAARRRRARARSSAGSSITSSAASAARGDDRAAGEGRAVVAGLQRLGEPRAGDAGADRQAAAERLGASSSRRARRPVCS